MHSAVSRRSPKSIDDFNQTILLLNRRTFLLSWARDPITVNLKRHLVYTYFFATLRQTQHILSNFET